MDWQRRCSWQLWRRSAAGCACFHLPLRQSPSKNGSVHLQKLTVDSWAAMRGTGAGEPPGLGLTIVEVAIPPHSALLLFGYAPKEVPLGDALKEVPLRGCARGLACAIGGESGIRTHGGIATTPVFKTGALNRSAISPKTDSVPSWVGLLGPSLGLTPAAMLACGARLRRSKFVPDEFVEPTVVSLPRRFSRPVP